MAELTELYVIESFRGVDSRPNPGFFTLRDAVVREATTAEVVEALQAEGFIVIGRDEDGQLPNFVKYGWVTSRFTGSIETTTDPTEAEVLIIPLDALVEKNSA